MTDFLMIPDLNAEGLHDHRLLGFDNAGDDDQAGLF